MSQRLLQYLEQNFLPECDSLLQSKGLIDYCTFWWQQMYRTSIIETNEITDENNDTNIQISRFNSETKKLAKYISH